ncbi:MAG TPA: sugar transferase, partial [Aggregatilineales bacterium]|nr:sugar transferase [Aggregatilineales bacterium]
ADDSRVTRVGRLLRRTKLDELPQLVNVLRGEMSIVGPRPEDPRYVALYTPEQRAQILSIRPGLTSPASVRFRDEEAALSGADWETAYVQQIMPAKLALDLEYVQNASLLRDVGLIVRTVAALWG